MMMFHAEFIALQAHFVVSVRGLYRSLVHLLQEEDRAKAGRMLAGKSLWPTWP
jgi:hypothetical protein